MVVVLIIVIFYNFTDKKDRAFFFMMWNPRLVSLDYYMPIIVAVVLCMLMAALKVIRCFSNIEKKW